MEPAAASVTPREAFRFWLKLGFINFGGPAGQIAIMHTELVDRKKWIDDASFLHALNLCMLLPGPEAQQLAIYIGWLLHRVLGGIVAGVLFVLPGAFIMFGLSWLYATQGEVGWVAAIFSGLSAAVVAIVISAVIRIGKKALKTATSVVVAATAFLAIAVIGLPFPVIVIGAGIAGMLMAPSGALPAAALHGAPRSVGTAEHHEGTETATTGPPPSRSRSAKVLGLGLLVWWGPLLLVTALRGSGDVLAQEAVFFSKAAMVTFGGAYAVLSYINQAAVEQYGWLEAGQMTTGLGLAESTPGPLIMVTQFVGFLAAYRNPGGLDPLLAGALGSLVTTWATFAPCFLWIFLGAPYVERLRHNVRLSAGLAAVTAAVVGVVGNLAVWFGIHTLFTQVRDVDFLLGKVPVPELASIDPAAVAIAAGSFYLLQTRRWSVVQVVGLSALAGLLLNAG